MIMDRVHTVPAPVSDHFVRKHSGLHTAMRIAGPISIVLWAVLLHVLRLI